MRPTGFFIVIVELPTPAGLVQPVCPDCFWRGLKQGNRWKLQLLSSPFKILSLKKCFSQLFRGAGAVLRLLAVPREGTAHTGRTLCRPEEHSGMA